MASKNAKHPKRLPRRFWTWLKTNQFLRFVLIAIAIPVCITILYNICIIEHRALEPESVLAYFGVALGIGFSFYELLRQREYQNRESRNARKPFLSLEVKKEESAFSLVLTNLGEQSYSDIFLFDELVTNALLPRQKLKLTVCNDEKTNGIRASSLFGWGDKLDEEGFPREINFYIYDATGEQWIASFRSSSTDNPRIYLCNVDEGY